MMSNVKTKGLFVIIVIVILLKVSMSAVQSLHLNQGQLSQEAPVMQRSQIAKARTRCADAAPADEQDCARLVRQILASTVRFEITGPDIANHDQSPKRIGHGTVKDGRFLVVHNHFSADLALFADESYADVAKMSMYTGIGDLFVWEARPPLFRVIVEEEEMLVLDFGADSAGEGFFESRGLQSAAFKNWQQESPSVGQEVAQIVWDYRRTTVDWRLIKEVITVDGVSRLVISLPLLPGASGGGVFWNKHHIAVNWQSGRKLGGRNEVLEEFSTAALNSNLPMAENH